MSFFGYSNLKNTTLASWLKVGVDMYRENGEMKRTEETQNTQNYLTLDSEKSYNSNLKPIHWLQEEVI